MNRMLSILVSTALVFGGFALAAGTASAAECKGLSKNVCEANDDCSWVGGYSRSDGAKVKGHCRAIPGKAKASSAREKARKQTDRVKGDRGYSDPKGKAKGHAKDKKAKAEKKAKDTKKKARKDADDMKSKASQKKSKAKKDAKDTKSKAKKSAQNKKAKAEKKAKTSSSSKK